LQSKAALAGSPLITAEFRKQREFNTKEETCHDRDCRRLSTEGAATFDTADTGATPIGKFLVKAVNEL
jgi:hypothetical protein